MRLIIAALCSVAFTGCAINLVRDPAPGSIDTGFPRIETTICDRFDVGENGCVFPQGKLTGSLKIARVLAGSITIVGSGCAVDKSFEYPFVAGSPAIDVDLKTLLGVDKLDRDCVLSIYQFVNYPDGSKAPFPIAGIYGSVTLGVCPDGARCSYSSEMTRVGWKPSNLAFGEAVAGTYTLRGCGRAVVEPVAFQGPLNLDLGALWPGGFPDTGRARCLFILGVKGPDGSTFKQYRKVTLFREDTIRLAEPALELSGSCLKFTGDPSVSLTLAGSKLVNSSKGKFKPSPAGDLMRFYTVQGRSLVAFVKDGKVVWTK